MGDHVGIALGTPPLYNTLDNHDNGCEIITVGERGLPDWEKAITILKGKLSRAAETLL